LRKQARPRGDEVAKYKCAYKALNSKQMLVELGEKLDKMVAGSKIYAGLSGKLDFSKSHEATANNEIV
jgi:hypothetical protein